MRHLSEATMAKILALKPLLHYFMYESKLMWHSKLRMLHYFKYHIKSPFLFFCVAVQKRHHYLT
jgi:hypothetical protein